MKFFSQSAEDKNAKEKEVFRFLFESIESKLLKACFAVATEKEVPLLDNKNKIEEDANNKRFEYKKIKFGAEYYGSLIDVLEKNREIACAKKDGKQSKTKSDFIDSLLLSLDDKKGRAEELQTKKEVFFSIVNLISHREELLKSFVQNIYANILDTKDFILNDQESNLVRFPLDKNDSPKTDHIANCKTISDFLNKDGVKEKFCENNKDKKSFYDQILKSIQQGVKDYKVIDDLKNSQRNEKKNNQQNKEIEDLNNRLKMLNAGLSTSKKLTKENFQSIDDVFKEGNNRKLTTDQNTENLVKGIKNASKLETDAKKSSYLRLKATLPVAPSNDIKPKSGGEKVTKDDHNDDHTK